MEQDQELTYFEYWLTKKMWPGGTAVGLIRDYIKFKRAWEPSDDYWALNTSFFEDIESKMHDDGVKHIFCKRAVSIEGYDNGGQWIEGKVDLEHSDVIPKEFLKWLHSKGYPMPHEFQVFIEIAEPVETLNEKQQQRVDKDVCQGVAKTLWDAYPDMTIEDMLDRKEILIYGSGKLYSRDTTLRRWLSEVDPRKDKTGPKRM